MDVYGLFNFILFVLIFVLWIFFKFKFCYIKFWNFNKIENVKLGCYIIELVCVV